VKGTRKDIRKMGKDFLNSNSSHLTGAATSYSIIVATNTLRTVMASFTRDELGLVVAVDSTEGKKVCIVTDVVIK
jgi:hypothetical protein